MNSNITLPNLLTSLRLVLVPVVVWLIVDLDIETAFWVFVAAAFTDLLDGNLARWLNQRTVLGAWLDPIADKAMLLSTLVSLAWVGFLPIWLILVVALRDAVVLSGAAAFRLLTGRLEVTPTLSGKLATFLEFSLVSLVLADVALAIGMVDVIPLLALLTALTVAISGLHYVLLWTGKTRRYLEEQRATG